jgi:hypothetical protein
MRHSLAQISLPPLALRQHHAARRDPYAGKGTKAFVELLAFTSFIGMCLGLVAEFS